MSTYVLKTHLYTGAWKNQYGAVILFKEESFFDAYQYGVEKNKGSIEQWKLKSWEFDGENWKLLRTTTIDPLLQPHEINPTRDNVLDYYNIEFSFGKPIIGKTSEKDFNEGFIVSVPGLSPCPWCAANMDTGTSSYKAVCVKNPLHKAIWLPWGG